MEILCTTLMKLHEFGKSENNYGALITTLLAALIIFFIKEYIRKPKNFSGTFFTKTKTLKTEYNPYEDLIIFHTLSIVSDGNSITGHSEKTGEISKKQSLEYIGEYRTQGAVTGRIERNYLRRSVLHILLEEQGKDRKYSTSLKIPLTKKMKGTFFSTAADSSGIAEWKEAKFLEHPSKSSPHQFIS